MSLHLFEHNGALRILLAYESGNVALREFVKSDRTTSVEGLGWKVLWKVKSACLHEASAWRQRRVSSTP
ncbi:hypothetical protein EDD85DRAFT_16785 [Armillaria nabsnona]|nr:hypothetical protein EDD85DRAFT_16785 [Armillaria nabsnona]